MHCNPDQRNPRISPENERLSDLELLTVLLGPCGGSDVHGIVRNLLYRFGSLRGLDRASVSEIISTPGMGSGRATSLKAGLELARRLSEEPLRDRPQFNGSGQVFDYVHLGLRDLRYEVFEIILVDARNRLLRRRRISTGTLTGSLVHPREVFRTAIVEGAAGLVLLHNHPSGDPTPSEEDLEVTARIVSAGDILGIVVLDHLVVGDGRYVSLADTGRIAQLRRQAGEE